MSTAKDKLLQYLTEAQATEQALASTLRAHIAMTPHGEYRDDLEAHLTQTRRHAHLVRDRIGQIGWSFNPLALGAGIVETVVGQVLAIGKAPLDMVRGMSMAEKLLKNAKDECATEALEIATYTAIAALAREAGDTQTAELAERIRREEEQFQERLLRHVPQLAADVMSSEVRGKKTADVTTVGAADLARKTTRRAATRARQTTRKMASAGRRAARTTARQTEEVAGQARRTARSSARRTEAAAGEARRSARSTTRTAARRTRATAAAARGSSAAGNREPWRGYDEQTASQIADRVKDLPDGRKERVREYEEQHKDRQTVVEAASSES